MKPIRTTHVTALRRSWIVLPVAIAVLAALSIVVSETASMHAASSGYSFRVIAKLGDPAPGGGIHNRDFEPQDINASGTVIFVSDLSGGTSVGEGVFRNSRGVNSQIVRTSLLAPGTNTTFGPFGILNPGGLNDAGDFAFGFTLDVPFQVFGTNAGVWRYSAATGKVAKVLLPGDELADGTTFRGTSSHTDLNNVGQIATVGIIETLYGHCNDLPNCDGLGRGVYVFDRQNRATKIAAPGDIAPGSGSVFDDAWDPNINDRGDIVFGGHVLGEPCIPAGQLGCFESLYLYRAGTRTLASLVHRGDPAPDAGVFEFAFNGRPNNVGDISFIGGNATFDTGVFLYTRGGSILRVAAPGDDMPGGGTMVNTTLTQGGHAINGASNVAFVAQLDSDTNGDGLQDTGVYLYRSGTIIPVVRTGTVIPSLGIVAYTNNADLVGGPWPWPGVHLNDRGEILTQVTLTDGTTHVVVATPW